MKEARQLLNSIPEECSEQHPKALPGTKEAFVRANDKKYGPVCHYAIKNQLYWVKNWDKKKQ
jgi:hypothetical protein